VVLCRGRALEARLSRIVAELAARGEPVAVQATEAAGRWEYSGRVAETYEYQQKILDELARHGLVPRPDTAPQQLRDAVRDLYKYEIRRLRDVHRSGGIAKRDYAGHVIALRKRYWLLSIPMELWTRPAAR
jgi:hypothetical protein